MKKAWRSLRVMGALGLVGALLACANGPISEGSESADAPAATSGPTQSGNERLAVVGSALWLKTPYTQDWAHWHWPGKKNQPFVSTTHQGRQAVMVHVNQSMSVLRQSFKEGALPLEPGALRFSWMVDSLFPKADLAVAEQDDAPVRLVLAFDGDRSKLSSRARMQSELSRTLLGEEMPYATLTYVWCNTRPVGTVLVSPRTDRVRKIVVESGASRVGQWRDYERDVQADFIKAFGEPPGRLLAIALMSDGDNTRSSSTAWYGPLTLQRRAVAP